MKKKAFKINSIQSQIKKEGKPVLPTKKQIHDPTKQGTNRKKALTDLNKRYSNIKRDVVDVIDKFLSDTPKEIKQANFVQKLFMGNERIYKYDVDQTQIADLTQLIMDILSEYLGVDPFLMQDPNYWLSAYVERAYDSGAADALQSAKNVANPAVVSPLTVQTIRTIPIEQLIQDPQYQRRVGLVAGRSFELMKGLTGSTRSDLSDTLARGMANGQSIKDIRAEIIDRIGVSKSRAERIARTEINNAYRTATRQETDEINDRLFADEEYEMQMLWFSALSPTTRNTHARRHGRTYTPAEVQEFYSKDANAINCLCSQVPALVNKKTGEIFQQGVSKEMSEQRVEWFGEEAA